MTKRRTQKKNLVKIKLDQCHLFGIKSPHALAKRLGWKLDKLISVSKDGKYRVYPHKETGRIIQEPSPMLQGLHRQLHRYLARISTPDYLHSSVKGRSYITNASKHVGNHPLIKIDIAKFYPSVPQYKVMHFFRDVMKCAPDVAGLLAKLTCYNAHLPTGSAISPILSFYTFRHLFDEIHSIALQHNLVMTCYVDDITLSGSAASRTVLAKIRTCIFRHGLRAHKDKYYRAGMSKKVTGVSVNQKISIPFDRWKKIQTGVKLLKKSTSTGEKLKLYPIVVSRFYEASQIETYCRTHAAKYHADWKALKLSI